MNDLNRDENQRAYWARQLDDAHDFMMRIRQMKVADCGEAIVSLPEAAAAEGVEVSFSSTPFAQHYQRRFYLRSGLVPAFLAAGREMNQRGWIMKVEDAYRSPEMQKAQQRTPALFDQLLKTVLWETGGRLPDTQLLYRRLLAMVAYCPAVGTHVSASALDISVMDRDSGRELDRGGSYPTFSIVTPMDSPYITPEAQRNRREITLLMRRHGFIEYPWEFWHYNRHDAYHAILENDPALARYGPVHCDFATLCTTPVSNPQEPLNSLDEIHAAMNQAMQRLHAK